MQTSVKPQVMYNGIEQQALPTLQVMFCKITLSLQYQLTTLPNSLSKYSLVMHLHSAAPQKPAKHNGHQQTQLTKISVTFCLPTRGYCMSPSATLNLAQRSLLQ